MNTQPLSPEGPRARVVVGVDGSGPSVGALRHAARLAQALDADLDAVTVWRLPPSYPVGPVPGWSPVPGAQKALDSTVELAFGGTPPARMTAQLLEGPIARTLIDYSRDAQMLVVGSRGHGGFAGMILGSVSSACAEYAHCPVLVWH